MTVKVPHAQAPFVPIAGASRAVIHQEYMGRAYVNVVGLDLTLAGGAPYSATSQAIALFNSWAGWLKPVMSDKWKLNLVEVRKLDTEGSETGASNLAQVQGNDESAALPRGVAVCIRLTTGGAGRARHGRIFLAGLAASSFHNEDNTLQPTFTQLLRDGFASNGLDSNMGSPSLSGGLAVLSHTRGPDGTRRVASVYDPVTNTYSGAQGAGSSHRVTDMSVRELVASQRKRNG